MAELMGNAGGSTEEWMARRRCARGVPARRRNEGGGGGLGSTTWRSARGDKVLAGGVDEGVPQGDDRFRIGLVIRLVKI